MILFGKGLKQFKSFDIPTNILKNSREEVYKLQVHIAVSFEFMFINKHKYNNSNYGTSVVKLTGLVTPIWF